MSWLDDPFWTDALGRVAMLSEQHRYILVPDDWSGLDSRYMPIGYGHALDASSCTAFAIAKDDADRLPRWLLAANLQPLRAVYANAVFVVYSSLSQDKVDADACARHLPYFLDRLTMARRGDVPREAAYNPRFARAPIEAEKRVLVVNASHMGNFGDELLAQATVELIGEAVPEARCDVVRPDFNVTPQQRYDAIVLGGGGVLYDLGRSGDGAKGEMPNIVNYFKYGFVAKDLHVPFVALGIGNQHLLGRPASLDARAFVTKSLSQATLVSARDDETAQELNALLGVTPTTHERRVRMSGDLALRLRGLRRPRAAPSPWTRVALCGQIGNFPRFWESFKRVVAASSLQLRFFIQANEDVDHSIEAVAAFPGLEIVDLRRLRVDDGIQAICDVDAVVTTRFHTLLVASANAVPTLALDRADGKKARLMASTEFPRASHRLVSNDESIEHCERTLRDWLAAAQPPVAFEPFDDRSQRVGELRVALRSLPPAAPARPPPQDLPTRPAARAHLAMAPRSAPETRPSTSTHFLEPSDMFNKNLEHKLDILLRKIDRLTNEVEFIKNRTSAYLGDGIGMTYLVDETPIYVNTNDFGCPANFINGGRYEEEHISILASFRRPGSVFLDVGANLGVFSLRLASMLRHGKVFAFEPNPKIHELLKRSVFLAGHADRVSVNPIGLSDQNTQLHFSVPTAHAGGGTLGALQDGEQFEIEVRRLDDWLPADIVPDIVKIDVEGHELHALRGMQSTLARSPNAVVLFEKLSAHSGIEAPLCDYFSRLGMDLYRTIGTTLVPVRADEFPAVSGYFVGARAQTVAGELERGFVRIYPADMHVVAGQVANARYEVDQALGQNHILFYGPYWYLPRGTYRLKIQGRVDAPMRVCITENFGYAVEEHDLAVGQTEVDVVIHRDLTKFEVVARAGANGAKAAIDHVQLTRLG